MHLVLLELSDFDPSFTYLPLLSPSDVYLALLCVFFGTCKSELFACVLSESGYHCVITS